MVSKQGLVQIKIYPIIYLSSLRILCSTLCSVLPFFFVPTFTLLFLVDPRRPAGHTQAGAEARGGGSERQASQGRGTRLGAQPGLLRGGASQRRRAGSPSAVRRHGPMRRVPGEPGAARTRGGASRLPSRRREPTMVSRRAERGEQARTDKDSGAEGCRATT